MGLFDKSKKKKAKEKEFLDLDDDLSPTDGDYGPAGSKKAAATDDDMGLPGTPPALQLSGPSGGGMASKDLELVNSKLSALKSEIEALRQRVRFIEEKMNLGEKEGMAQKYGTTAPKETGWHY